MARRRNACKCEVCGKVFYTVRWGAKTCGATCRKRLQRSQPDYVDPRSKAGQGSKGAVSHTRRVCDTQILPDVSSMRLADLERLCHTVKL